MNKLLNQQSDALITLQTALWSNPALREERVKEVMVEYGALKPEAAITEIAKSLLGLSEKDSRILGIQNPFYRLTSQERVVLSLLHLQRWSYQELSQVLDFDESQIEEVAWRARMHLAANAGVTQILPVPTGSRYIAIDCPEYNVYKPWTQKFLDDQMHAQEKYFVQSHMKNCENCSISMKRAKAFYHAISAWVPRPQDFKTEKDYMMKSWRQARVVVSPTEMTFVESLQIFFARREIQITMGVILFLFILVHAEQALSK